MRKISELPPADAGYAQRLPFGDAGGNLHIDLALATSLIQHDSPFGSGECLLHRYVQVARVRVGLTGSGAPNPAGCRRTGWKRNR